MKSPTEWNLNLLYKSDNDPKIEKDRSNAKRAIEKFVKSWKNTKKYLTDPATLLKALKDYEELNEGKNSLIREAAYLSLRLSIDSANDKLKAKYNQFNEFAVKLSNEIEFFGINISKIPTKEQKKFLNYKPLHPYKHFLERSFLAGKYILTEAEEKIISLTNKTSTENWTDMVEEFISKETRLSIDDKGKKKERTMAELGSLMSSRIQKVRDSASKNFNEVLKKYVAVSTKELNSILEYKKTIDQLRGLDRPDLQRHIDDDIDTEMVDTLVKTVSKYFTTSHKYYTLKAKILGKKKLKYYERNVKIGEIAENFPYEKSKTLVLDTFGKLDKEIKRTAEAFFNQGRIDVFPKKSKRGGAFSFTAAKFLPGYIMLNHNNEVNDVLTLAHELGHGVNGELMKKKENILNYEHSTATAEVASTFFEDFTLETLKKGVNKETQFALLFEKLNQDISTIHRQVAAYKFEQELHESFNKEGYLPTESIQKIFKKHMSAYLGPQVELETGAENWWVYWSHFRNYFYVYSYASGLLISKSLQASVKQNPSMMKKVKEFLSTGMSISPKELFMNLGIDITDSSFWEKGLKEVEVNLLEAERLAEELGKI